MMKKILTVDDEHRIRMILKRMLESDGYLVETAKNGVDAILLTDSFAPDLILLDLKMPDMDGMEVLRVLQEKQFTGKIIVITAFGSIPSAVEAMRKGAFDYINKPFEPDELSIIIERALQQSNVEKELNTARVRLQERYSVESIICINSEMSRLLGTVQKIAPTDVAVLISGASGTGKELFANAIHQHSKRKNRPFIPVNCSAIPGNLIESELFGYKKGAFSGADSSKPGLVEEADTGTLFLDEVGELAIDLQAKLLRFLQDGEFIPLGATKSQKVDVRIISATNSNLLQNVNQGKFREDLYYRLNVVSLEIPPLSERKDDIPFLVDHFLVKHSEILGKKEYRFSPEVLEQLQLYHWPGNVRELENAIRSALVMASQTPMRIRDLPVNITAECEDAIMVPSGNTLHEIASSFKEAAEKKAITKALKKCGDNKTKAAQILGIGRRTLFRKMKLYKIN